MQAASPVPATKSLRSGICARVLLQAMRSAWRPSLVSSWARSRPKKRGSVRTPAASAARATFCGGLDAQHGNPGGDEVAQQVAIVTAHFDDEALRSEPQLPLHLVRHTRRTCSSQLVEKEEK